MLFLCLKAISHWLPVTTKKTPPPSDPTWPAFSHLQAFSLRNHPSATKLILHVSCINLCCFPCPRPSLRNCFQVSLFLNSKASSNIHGKPLCIREAFSANSRPWIPPASKYMAYRFYLDHHRHFLAIEFMLSFMSTWLSHQSLRVELVSLV